MSAMASDDGRDQRALGALGKRPIAELTRGSSPAALEAWVSDHLSDTEFGQVSLNDISAADVLDVATDEDLAVLLSTTLKVACKLRGNLLLFKRPRTSASIGSPDENAHNANRQVIVKPDPHGPAAAAAAVQPLAAHHSDNDHDDEDSDVQVIVKPEAAAEAVLQDAAPHDADVDMADAAPPPPHPDGGDVSPEGSDDEDEDDDDFDADDVGAAVAELCEPAPEPVGVAAPQMPPLPAVELKAPRAIELPEDAAAAQRYIERALTGFSHFLFDVPQVCYYVAKELGVGPKGPRAKRKLRALAADMTHMGLRVWQELDSRLNKDIPADPAAARERVEALAEQVKHVLHVALSKQRVQTSKGFLGFLRRAMPVEIAERVVEVEAEEGGQDVTEIKDQHLVVPPNIVETVWDLWQTAPLLCSLEIPVVMKRAAVFKTQIEFRGVVSLSRAHQFEYFVEPTRKANGNKRDNITLSALQDGPKAAQSEDVLEAVRQIVRQRHENRVAAEVAGLSSFISLHHMPGEEPDSLRRIAKISLYVDIALVGKTLGDGFSGFVQYNATRAVIADVLRYSNEFAASPLGERIQRWHEADARHAEALTDFVAGENPRDGIDGLAFQRLLKEFSDTAEVVPEGLKERCSAVLTIEPRPYQLAAIGFIEAEEKAADGLQRHLWWKMELPGAEGVLAYVSPVFNAVWVASAKAHFNAGADLNNSTNRRSPGHTLHLDDVPRGGMLAFEMGLGKTLCVIAAHALEQHTVPEAQEETELTEEQLEQEYVEVLVGKRFPEEPDREKLKTAKMYRGFKQIDDGRGTIVPDGSLRFRGRGNLVIVPSTLATQWQREIERRSSQAQNVIVVDEINARRKYLSTRSGLRELAEADWVITAPGKFVRDLEMYGAITWRRVIVDEVHLVAGRVPGDQTGWNKLQKEVALLEALAALPCTVARWCLSGTPLKNYKQVHSMDRVFALLRTGFRTAQCHNVQFVAIMDAIAMRFTKAGKFLGESNVDLPPVTENVRTVQLNHADRRVYNAAVLNLIAKADVPREWLMRKQARAAARGAGSQMMRDSESEDSDEDEPEKTREARRRTTTAFKMMGCVIDPTRRVLSAATQVYFNKADDGTIDIVPDELAVGEPADFKRPKTKEGPVHTNAEWKAERALRADRYVQIEITSKVDVMIADIKEIMEAGEEVPGRPPKVIIYSNFEAAFKRIRNFLERSCIPHSYLNGQMPAKKRDAMLQAFIDDDAMPVFLLNRGCGAVGLNLTVATHVLILETSWNPVWESQAIGRAHRLGQKGPISVNRYVCENTVESRLRDLMLIAHEAGDGVAEEELATSVQCKATGWSDEKALNQTVVKLFNQCDLATIVGDIEQMETELEAEDPTSSEEEEEEAAAKGGEGGDAMAE